MPLTRLRRRRVEGRKGLSGARHSHLTNAARNGDFTSPGTGIFSDWKWFVREEFGNGREIGKRSTGTYASAYFRYYNCSRLHLSLDKDSPDPRTVQCLGQVIAIPQVGGLHHHYERRAA